MNITALNDIISASVRIATPITLAALGGVFCQKAAIFNIGLEGMMLVGSFAVICGQIAFPGSIAAGMLFAIAAGIALSLLFALAVLRFDANQIITGIGINLLGVGLTSFLLRAVYDTQGTLRAEVMGKLPTISLPFLKDVPILGGIFGEQNLLTYISFLMVLVTALLLYQTPFGISARAIGEVQGRGFTAFSALIFGNGNPFVTWAVSILFGFADALGIRVELNSAWMSSSIIKMFPYLLSVAALAVSCYAREASRRKKKA